MSSNHAIYLEKVMRPHELISAARLDLEKNLSDFDAFIGTGISGGPAVALLGYVFGKPFCIVRKQDDLSNHSMAGTEAGLLSGRFLIVDDLIATGSTLTHITNRMIENLSQPCVAGVWTYQGNSLARPNMGPDYYKHFEIEDLMVANGASRTYIDKVMHNIRQMNENSPTYTREV